jgi:hypothetical protein
LWLLLPLAALGIIEGLKEWRAGQLAPELASARQLLEQASKVAERQAEVDKEFKHVAEKLKEAEQELAESSEPLREALRTLAELEERLSRPSELSDAERSALADALAQNHPEFASDLRAGRNAEAARTVAQLDPAELAKALEQAARHLESRRLREIASEEGQMVQVQLGMMLGASGEFGKEDGRRQFVATLREMKTGPTSAAAQDGQKVRVLIPRSMERNRHPARSNRNRRVRRARKWISAVAPNWGRKPSRSRARRSEDFLKASSAMALRSSSSSARPAAMIHRPDVPTARLIKLPLPRRLTP